MNFAVTPLTIITIIIIIIIIIIIVVIIIVLTTIVMISADPVCPSPRPELRGGRHRPQGGEAEDLQGLRATLSFLFSLSTVCMLACVLSCICVCLLLSFFLSFFISFFLCMFVLAVFV